MPPERKATGSNPTTVEDLMGDGPGPDAIDPQAVFMETVAADNNPYPDGQENEEIETDGEEVLASEEDGREEAHADADGDEQEEGHEEEGQVEEEGVTVSRDAYDRILAMLGIDEDEVEAPKATAETEEAPKPVAQPITASELKLPTTYDELIEMQSDPEKYANHVNALIQQAVERTVSAMEPVINERAGYLYQAMEFDKKFFEKHPDVPVKLAVKGLATAQKTLGPDASWDALFAETEKNCAFAMGVAKSMKRATGRTQDRVGRNAPKTTRTSRPTLGGPKASTTEEVLQNIMRPTDYDAQTTELLRDVGTM